MRNSYYFCFLKQTVGSEKCGFIWRHIKHTISVFLVSHFTGGLMMLKEKNKEPEPLTQIDNKETDND